MTRRGRGKSRVDVMGLMHVFHCGEDALPLQLDTEL